MGCRARWRLPAPRPRRETGMPKENTRASSPRDTAKLPGGGKTVVAEVADTCPGCAVRSLDMSKGLFELLATLDVGLLGLDSYTKNITWKLVEGSGALPALPFTP